MNALELPSALPEAEKALAYARQAHQDGVSFETILSNLNFSVEKATLSSEAIQKLNELDIFVYKKFDILLAALGEKPATHLTFTLDEWNAGNKGEESFKKEAEKLFATTTALGLYAATDTRIFEDAEAGAYQVESFSFSRSQENARLTSRLFWSLEQSDELVLGKLLGFPDTAISAFVSETGMIAVDHLPSAIPEDGAFISFRMSTANVEEEIKTVRRWAAATKAADEALYYEILNYSSN